MLKKTRQIVAVDKTKSAYVIYEWPPRRQTHDGNGSDEEEIDDDEENALSALRNVRNNGSSDMSTPPVPTEDVISLLLQRQTPVNSNLNRTDNAADTSDRPAGNNSQSEKEQSSSS